VYLREYYYSTINYQGEGITGAFSNSSDVVCSGLVNPRNLNITGSFMISVLDENMCPIA